MAASLSRNRRWLQQTHGQTPPQQQCGQIHAYTHTSNPCKVSPKLTAGATAAGPSRHACEWLPMHTNPTAPRQHATPGFSQPTPPHLPPPPCYNGRVTHIEQSSMHRASLQCRQYICLFTLGCRWAPVQHQLVAAGCGRASHTLTPGHRKRQWTTSADAHHRRGVSSRPSSRTSGPPPSLGC